MRSLVTLSHTLPALPKNRYLTVKLLYLDDKVVRMYVLMYVLMYILFMYYHLYVYKVDKNYTPMFFEDDVNSGTRPLLISTLQKVCTVVLLF